MRATVHLCAREPGLNDLRHNFRDRARRSEPERGVDGSRVHAVAGDVRGVGVVPLSSGMEKSLLKILRGEKKGKREGRNLRQIILSGEDMPEASDAEYGAALDKLMRVAQRWVEMHAPGCRWVATAHSDRHHPHVHLVVENWDYQRGKRLDLGPKLLERMQGMEWCTDLGIESGRGSKGRVKAGKELAKAGVTLDTAEWQERVQLLAAEGADNRSRAAADLVMWCQKHQPPRTVDGLTTALESLPLPEGWTTKTRTIGGALLRRPSINIAGTTLRLDTFLSDLAPAAKKTKTKEKEPER